MKKVQNGDLTPFRDFDETVECLFDSMHGIEKSTQKVFISDALGMVLAEDVVAKENSPTAPTSSMDGYAFRFVDQELGTLHVKDKLPAGTFKESLEVGEASCVKTFTGSLMSSGSDTLIPIENVEVDGDKIKIIKPVAKGYSVRPIGESYSKGEVLIKKGTKIGFAQIGVMAELGFVMASVHVKPKVAIIATGSEILDIGETKTNPAQIRSTNHITLEAIAKNSGADVRNFGVLQDDMSLIKNKITEAFEDNDIVITTGGVSVGDYDFVKDIIKDMSLEYIVDGSAVKPGRHIKIVKLGKKYIVALPGFPYSSTVMFFTYVLPLIKKMQGLNPKTEYVDATIEEDYKKRSPFTEFTACNLELKNGKYVVNLKGKRVGSSAILNNMLDGSALLRVEQTTKLIKKGEMVRVLRVSDI